MTAGPSTASAARRAPARARGRASNTGTSSERTSAGKSGCERATPVVRRMMTEYGEHFWRDRWAPLYSVLGGNPLAAMPSLHFATSLMAALLLAEVGVVAGALGFAYTFTLGFALVYLGEHYASDVLTGAVVGTAIGLGVPLLHHYRTSPVAQTTTLHLVPLPNGIQIAGTF